MKGSSICYVTVNSLVYVYLADFYKLQRNVSPYCFLMCLSVQSVSPDFSGFCGKYHSIIA